MKRGVVMLVVLSIPVLFASACASRSWTRTLFEKQEAEIDERFVRVEQRSDQNGEQLGALANRVTILETSVEQTAAMARGAQDQAEMALARADAVENRLSRPASAGTVPEPLEGKTLLGVVHVRFGLNRADLDERAEQALLTVLEEMRGNPSLTVALEGATDTRGSRTHNLRLSRRRVEAVRRYLLARGLASPRVIRSSAVGPLRDRTIPEEQKRRVAVKLMQTPE